MAKGIKTGGKNFEKGREKTGGRIPLSEMEKQAREMCRYQIAEAWIQISQMSLSDLEVITVPKSSLNKKQLIKREEYSLLHLFLAGIFTQGAKKGDVTGLNLILDRLLGKAQSSIAITGTDGNPIRISAREILTSKLSSLSSK